MNDQDRKTEDIKAPCQGCSGVGFNQFEPVCEECGGSGRVTVEIYVACGCPVEECECETEAEVNQEAAA